MIGFRRLMSLGRAGALALPCFFILQVGSQAQEVDAAAILEMWKNSAHADASAQAFTHWDDEGEIPPTCAACHSGEGFRNFIGADGNPPGLPEHPIPIGSLIDCETCHAPEAMALSSVTFPSGVTVEGVERGAVCMTCHQGRTATEDVRMSVAALGDDEVNAELAFVNVHYSQAAATMMGSEVHGGYEYDGKSYMGRFAHVPPFSACTDCHNPHTLEVRVETCVTCHGTEEPSAIRMGTTDFDGDGDTAEGIAAEIARMHDLLGEAIMTYSSEVAAAPIVYAGSYPYWFADSDGDRLAGEGEAIFPNAYKSWTPRLLKAAYNYHFIREDPGAYAHNPHYALQILYDSIESLGQQISFDMAALQRP